MVFTTEGLFELAIESWPEWDLNPQPLNSVECIGLGMRKILAHVIRMQNNLQTMVNTFSGFSRIFMEL